MKWGNGKQCLLNTLWGNWTILGRNINVNDRIGNQMKVYSRVSFRGFITSCQSAIAEVSNFDSSFVATASK